MTTKEHLDGKACKNCKKCKYRTTFAGDVACWYYILSNGKHRVEAEDGTCLTFEEGKPMKEKHFAAPKTHTRMDARERESYWDMRFSS